MCVPGTWPIMPRPLDRARLMTLIATPATTTRNGAAPASLAGRLAAGNARAVVTFAGQGVDVLEELAALAAQRPELRAGISLATDVLGEVAASDLARASGAYRHGVDVAAWVLDPDGAPPVAYLRGAAVAYPLSLLAQALLWRAVWSRRHRRCDPRRLDRRARRPLPGPARRPARRRRAGRSGRRRAPRRAPPSRRGPGHPHVRGIHGPVPDGVDRRHRAGTPRTVRWPPPVSSRSSTPRRGSSSPGRRGARSPPHATHRAGSPRGGRAARRPARRRAAALRVVAARRRRPLPLARAGRGACALRRRRGRRGLGAGPRTERTLAGARTVRRAGALGRRRAGDPRPRRGLGARPRPGHRGRAAHRGEPARQRAPDARARLA